MKIKPVHGETTRTQLREKLGARIDEAFRSEVSGTSPLSGFYVFFSFDLVDATRYKEVDPEGWPLVISRFYELITRSAEKSLGRIRLWKLVGDEVLLHKRIRSLTDLHICIPSAHAILTDSVNRLHREFPKSKPLLSIKGVVWCARVHHVPPQELGQALKEFREGECRNIVVPQLGGPELAHREHLDFLGPEIDTGFRIAKHVVRRRLVVSAELAYLLHRERANCEPIEHQLKIVSFEPLKGVWGGRRYPIIWFEPDWKKASGSFEYDERFGNEIVKRIISGKELFPLSDLPGVYEDLNRLEEVDALHRYVSQLQPGEDEEVSDDMVVSAAHGPAIEVHCAAVCFRRSDGRVLLAKRPLTKRRFGGQWEFGCGQLTPNEDFMDALKRAYLEDFSAELVFPGGLQPAASYLMRDEEQSRTIPGVIFVAEVENPENVEAHRHAEISWFDPSDPMDLPPEEDCVPSLRQSLANAVAVRERSMEYAQEEQIA